MSSAKQVNHWYHFLTSFVCTLVPQHSKRELKAVNVHVSNLYLCFAMIFSIKHPCYANVVFLRLCESTYAKSKHWNIKADCVNSISCKSKSIFALYTFVMVWMLCRLNVSMTVLYIVACFVPRNWALVNITLLKHIKQGKNDHPFTSNITQCNKDCARNYFCVAISSNKNHVRKGWAST